MKVVAPKLQLGALLLIWNKKNFQPHIPNIERTEKPNHIQEKLQVSSKKNLLDLHNTITIILMCST